MIPMPIRKTDPTQAKEYAKPYYTKKLSTGSDRPASKLWVKETLEPRAPTESPLKIWWLTSTPAEKEEEKEKARRALGYDNKMVGKKRAI